MLKDYTVFLFTFNNVLKQCSSEVRVEVSSCSCSF